MSADHAVVGCDILAGARRLECINRDAERGETCGNANGLRAPARTADVVG